MHPLTTMRSELAAKQALLRGKRPHKLPTIDPYEFDRAIIPKGKSYQWIAIEVKGKKQNISRALSEGWKPVPFKRHSKVFPDSNSKGRIVIDGLMLVENTQFWVDHQLARNTLEAEWSDAQRNLGFFGSANGIDLPFGSVPQLPSGAFQGEWKPSHAEPLDIQVTITLRLLPGQLDAADALNLTPQEYGQRVARMMPLMPMHPDYYGVPHLFPKEEK